MGIKSKRTGSPRMLKDVFLGKMWSNVDVNSRRVIAPENYADTSMHRIVRTHATKIKRPCDLCGRITKRVYKVEYYIKGADSYWDMTFPNNFVWAPICSKDCKLMFLFRYSWV